MAKLTLSDSNNDRISGFIISVNCLVAVFLFNFSPGVLAQGAFLEEIIVTAQKREESIQDVGIAITAFSAEQIKTLGFNYSLELAAFTPGVHSAADNDSPQFAIRGVTQNDFADIPEPPSSVYVDEAYQATGQSHKLSTFDLERAEILKGPQGTLFGRNATGGLVHFITKKPTKEFEAYGDLTLGSYDTIRFEGAVSGPLMDTVSARVSVFHNEHDTVMDNTFSTADLPATPGFLAFQGRGPLTSNPDNNDDIWDNDQSAVRGQLLWEPNADVTVLLTGHYAYQEKASFQFQELSTVAIVDDTDGDGVEDQTVDTAFAADILDPANPCENISVNTGLCVNSVFDLDFDGVRPDARGDFFGAFEADGSDGLDVQQDHTLSDSNRFGIHGFTGKLTWDLGFATLISVSAYSKQTKRETLDVDSGPAPQFITMKESEWDWFTQELRLEGETDRFRWIVGAYYLTLDTAYSQGLADTIGGINVFAGLFFNGFLTTANDFIEGTVNAELETDSYSLFGQVDYDLTDQLMLSVGFRGIIEEKDYTFTNRLYTNRRDDRVDGALFGGGSPFVNPFTGDVFEFLPPFADDTSDFLWSGKVQLNWQPNEDWLVYAGVNRGVKAGSFNAPLLTFLTPDEYGYDEEVLLAYEAGFKSTLLDGKARLNVAGYYYDYSDYQAFQFIGTSGAIFNVDAEHMGVEAELVAKPVENLDLLLGLGFIDPEVEDLLVAPNTPRDTEPTFTPEIQFNGIGRYTFPGAIMGGDVALQVDGNYASSTFYNINNFGTHRMGSYWLGNIRISWVSADERLEIGGFVKNVGDTRYQRSGFELSAICGCDEAGYGEPRWWGATIRYSIY